MRKRSAKAKAFSKSRASNELKRRRISKAKKLVANSKTVEARFATTYSQKFPFRITVPAQFCLLSNRHELLAFFRRVEILVGKGITVLLDLTNIQSLAPEALLYLLSYMDQLRERGQGQLLMGNTPSDPGLKSLLACSGFYEYVFTSNPLGQNSSHILKIETGFKVQEVTAKKVKDFAQRHLGFKDKKKGLYPTIIECMANTNNHAAGKLGSKKWWLMALQNKEKDCVHFTFLDNGSSIPKTVAKKFFTDGFSDDSSLILSALKGELRSRTKLTWRGKGLPKVYASCKKELISNLVILSGKGCYESGNESNSDSNEKFRGTLLAWDYTRDT